MANYQSIYTGSEIDEAIEIVFDGLIEKTYAELKEIKDAGKLIPGAKYKLTDYVTKYRQPYTNVIKKRIFYGGYAAKRVYPTQDRYKK